MKCKRVDVVLSIDGEEVVKSIECDEIKEYKDFFLLKKRNVVWWINKLYVMYLVIGGGVSE